MTQTANEAKFYFTGAMYACPNGVYFPSEDSYFLAENAVVPKGSIVADVGCGSGIQSLNALMQGAAKVYAIDLNPDALRAAKENAAKAGYAGKLIAVKSDLLLDFW